MTRWDAKVIYDEISVALKAIAQKHNLETSQLKMAYDDSEIRFNFKANVLGDNGNKVVTAANENSALRALLREGYKVLNGDVKVLGAEVKVNGIPGKVVIVDYKSNRPKYPFVVKTAKGDLYKLTVATIGNALKIEREPTAF